MVRDIFLLSIDSSCNSYLRKSVLSVKVVIKHTSDLERCSKYVVALLSQNKELINDYFGVGGDSSISAKEIDSDVLWYPSNDYTSSTVELTYYKCTVSEILSKLSEVF